MKKFKDGYFVKTFITNGPILWEINKYSKTIVTNLGALWIFFLWQYLPVSFFFFFYKIYVLVYLINLYKICTCQKKNMYLYFIILGFIWYLKL